MQSRPMSADKYESLKKRGRQIVRNVFIREAHKKAVK